jgi:hypothetical protein
LKNLLVLSYLRGTILLQCRENRGWFCPTVARNYSAATLQKTGKVLTYRCTKSILLLLEPTDKPGTYLHGVLRSIGRTIMTKRRLLVVTSAIGLVLAAIPASIKLSPANVTSLSLLSLDTADARIGRPLTPLSVAGVNRRAHRRAYYGGRYGTGVGVGVGVAAGAVAVGAATTGFGYPESASAPSYVIDAVQVEPGFNATVTDPATGRRCTISTTGRHWCWAP